MEININNKKALERLLNQSIGYSLFTVSSEYGVQKIALKKKMFKDSYTLIYCSGEENNDDVIKTVDVNVKIKKDGSLSIKNFSSFTIEDACFTLKNPARRVLTDTQALRKMASCAEKRTRIECDNYTSKILEQKETEFKEYKDEMSSKLYSSVYGRLEPAYALGHSLVDVFEYKHTDTLVYEKGYEEWAYKHTLHDDERKTFKYGVYFITELLKKELKCYLSEESIALCDELDLIYKKVDAAYYKKTNTSDEFLENVDKIQRLYGYMAYGLKSIIFDLCDHLKKYNCADKKIEYLEWFNDDNWKDGNHHIQERRYEKVDDCINAVLDGSSEFIERVTGIDIRDEINKRLGREATDTKTKSK